MDTPICDFVKQYMSSNPVRFHMPGHKGIAFTGPESSDITEINGADVLYSSSGIIRKSEENATSLFGTARTIYSAEGSSLSIRAMLFLLKSYCEIKKRKPFILAARNSHKVFITTAALLDIDVSWIFPENGSYISCDIAPDRLEKIILSMDRKPDALYLTSPDYLGNIADIKSISEICHKYDILLLTDNAHGAYLNFLKENKHPIHLGADICCDSAHKTLPVLTGGAYLHISAGAPDFFAENCERAMSVFASTSPSYLILQSLDKVNLYLFEDFAERLNSFICQLKQMKEKIRSHGYELYGNEEMKLTVKTKSYGYTGTEFASILEKENIFIEFYDNDYIVMMFTPQNTDEDMKKLEKVLLGIQKRTPIESLPPDLYIPVSQMTPHQVLYLPSYEEKAETSKGKILASPTVSCPPAIPIVSMGEVIDENAIRLFEYYNVEKVTVLS